VAVKLVGTIGTAVQAASGVALSTWAWGASENRTAGNLLIATVTVTGSATLPTTPSGWSIAKQVAGTSCSATIYYKLAAGADAVPTIAAITSGLIAGQLSEWSGAARASIFDVGGVNSGTSSPITATATGAQGEAGELIIMAGADRRSVARASNDTWTSNQGTPTLAGSNNGTSSTGHYSAAYIASSSSTTAATAIMTLSITTSITGLAVAEAAFNDLELLPSGIGSAAALGSATLGTGHVDVIASGIDTDEGFGTAIVSLPVTSLTVSPTGIGPAAGLGTPKQTGNNIIELSF
jgi:hypothetical protein